MNSAGTQLVFYNRKRYLAGFDYQEPELQIMKLTPDRTALDGSVLTVAGLPSGTGMKGSAELVTVNGEQLLYFNQYGLFRSINASATDYLHFASLVKVSDDETLQLDSKGHFGDLRRSYNESLFLGTDEGTGHYTVVDNAAYSAGPAQEGYLPAQPFRTAQDNSKLFASSRGLRQYELKDHLGNVHAVVTDRRMKNGSVSVPQYVSLTAYYPFGMTMPGKDYNSGEYRYGFNGKERETSFDSDSYDFGARVYNSLTGKWMSVDPLFKKGPQFSPFAFSFNNPILFKEENGKWPLYAHYQMTKTALIKVGYSEKVASEIAHYSAVYADNPNPNKTTLGNFIMKFNQSEGEDRGIPKSELDYKQGVDYSATNNSQSDEDISAASIHATRTWWEDISPEDAVTRALCGGTFKDINGNDVTIEGALNVIEKFNGVKEADLSTSDKMAIGKALHTIQDVSAHNGARFVDEHKNEAAKKGKDFKNTHSVNRDLFGDTKDSETATSEATEKIKQNE